MEDNLGPLIPIVFIVFMFGAWIVSRMLRHRERMAMLRMGIIPPRDMRRWQKHGGPVWGPGTMPPPGMQMSPGAPFPPNAMGYEDPDSAQGTLRAGVKTTMVGLALLIGLSFIGYHADRFPPIHPGPWLLGGLIPMFVGIAQIIIALISGATFGMRAPLGPPPNMTQSQPPGPNAPFGTSHPSPPGPRYEELARPAQPPDRT
jgi:hypothetical protein